MRCVCVRVKEREKETVCVCACVSGRVESVGRKKKKLKRGRKENHALTLPAHALRSQTDVWIVMDGASSFALLVCAA